MRQRFFAFSRQIVIWGVCLAGAIFVAAPSWSLNKIRDMRNILGRFADGAEDAELLYAQLLDEPQPPLSEPESLAVANLMIDRLSPGELDQLLRDNPQLKRGVMGALGAALAGADPSLVRRLGQYVSAMNAAACFRLQKSDAPWTTDDLGELAALMLVDAPRFARDPAFRNRVLEIMPEMLPPGISFKLRDRVLIEINKLPGVTFDLAEQIEWQWCSIQRPSRDREVAPGDSGAWRLAEGEGAIAASIYSLPRSFFDQAEAEAFLRAVREANPNRALLALSDLNQYGSFRDLCEELGVHLIETHGRDYTPWLRDPISFFRDPSDRLIILQRPNRQERREEDYTIGREIIQGLPNRLDEALGKVRWGVAETAFHNGKILITPEAIWINLDSLEVRTLELMRLERVPVASFDAIAGVERFLGAAKEAIAELEALYRKPVRLVHDWPDRGALEKRRDFLFLLGGLAGYDLDSLVAILPGPTGKSVAYVGDLSLGSDLVEKLGIGELSFFGGRFGLTPAGEDLRRALRDGQRETRSQALARGLDAIAQHLDRQGLTTVRLPLLRISTRLLDRQARSGDADDFLITWTNVVVDFAGEKPRAEGFSSLLPRGDALALRAFREAGHELVLTPPLVGSVLLGGGYRCASKHVRR